MAEDVEVLQHAWGVFVQICMVLTSIEVNTTSLGCPDSLGRDTGFRPCPVGFVVSYGSCYVFLNSSTPLSSQEFEDHCQSVGIDVHLAELDTMQEFNASRMLVDMEAPITPRPFVGAWSSNGVDFFWTQSGSRVADSMWIPNKPSPTRAVTAYLTDLPEKPYGLSNFHSTREYALCEIF